VRKLRIAFAGDRDIALKVLDYLLAQGIQPKALMLTASSRASHADELRARCAFLEDEYILWGSQFRQPEGQALLRSLNLDFVLGIHFPYIVPAEVLEIPRIGVLNLHPAFLPYNRGWHTPSWAILEDTPIGATLHFMDTGVDTGDIVHQKQLSISPGDTAHTLYRKLKLLEFEVFQEAWPQIVSGAYQRQVQDPSAGTTHRRQELFEPLIQKIDLAQSVEAGELLRRLRALTTNRIDEAAYYEVNGRRYRVQLVITEETQE
jgi:methionyl-tRNA formyltransferase